MPILKKGASSPDVIKLQQRLQESGFDPGEIDGVFGAATEAALIAFQQSKGLSADGIAGPQTCQALGQDDAATDTATMNEASSTLPSVAANVTANIVSKMFPGTPIGNINQNLPFILTALQEAGLADKDMVLMALATIRAETGSFKPISEGISKFNTSPGSHPFDLYDDRQDLGNQGRPDGAQFKGRGFIQLTGRANYRTFSQVLGLGNQLIDNPELANQPDIAAKLLAAFLKNKEQRIRDALLNNDLKRRGDWSMAAVMV